MAKVEQSVKDDAQARFNHPIQAALAETLPKQWKIKAGQIKSRPGLR
jgi:hypothetical protein